MKAIIKISVFAFLFISQLTPSFAHFSTTQFNSEEEKQYLGVWFIVDGEELKEVSRILIDGAYLKEGNTVQERIDLNTLRILFNVNEITKVHDLFGKKAFYMVYSFSEGGCPAWDYTDWEEYCTTTNTGITGENVCVTEEYPAVPEWCLMEDPNHPCFGWGVQCDML